MSAMSCTPRHLAVTAVLTGLVLLGACSSGDDNAKPSDKVPSGNTATTQPTKTSAAPTSTSPTKTQAPKPTKQGAIDTALAGIKAIDHAYATWDVGPLRQLSAQSCIGCQDLIANLPLRKKQGFTMSGGRYKVIGQPQLIAGRASHGYVLIKVPTSITKLVTRTANGDVYNNSKDVIGSDTNHDSVVTNLDLKWSVDKWSIANLGYNE